MSFVKSTFGIEIILLLDANFNSLICFPVLPYCKFTKLYPLFIISFFNSSKDRDLLTPVLKLVVYHEIPIIGLSSQKNSLRLYCFLFTHNSRLNISILHWKKYYRERNFKKSYFKLFWGRVNLRWIYYEINTFIFSLCNNQRWN